MYENRSSCGSAFRLASNVEGRLDDELIYGAGVRVHPQVFRSALGRDRRILEYRVLQTRRGADIEAVCASPVDADGLARILTDRLEELGVAGAKVSFRALSRLERHGAAAKIRRFVPLKRQTGEPRGSPDLLFQEPGSG